MSDPGIELGDSGMRLSEGTTRPTLPKRYRRLTGAHGQFHESMLIRKGVTTVYRCPGVARVGVRARVRDAHGHALML